MDSYSYYFLFPKRHTLAYTRFENGCSENSTQKLYGRKKLFIWSVRIGKNCALGLEHGPRAVLKTSGTVFPKTDLPAGK